MANVYWAVLTWGDSLRTAQRQEMDYVGPFDDEYMAQEVRDSLLDAYKHLLAGCDFAAYVVRTSSDATPEGRPPRA